MADRRRDLLVEWIERQIGGRPKNERLPLGLAASTLATGAKGWRALPVKNRTAAIAWLAGQRPVVDGEELGGALLESACDWLRGSTPDGDVPPGPGGEPAPHGGGGGQGADVTELEDRVSDLMARENGPAQRFRLVKSQLTAEEARRLEANGWTASVVWVCDDHGEQHERFPDDLALLRSEARPDDGEAPAGEPTGTCSCPACGRGPVRFGGRCDRCGEKLEADVKPPHNAGEGSLCEAARRLAVATGGDPDQAADAAQATRMANLIAEEPARTQLDGPADPAAIDRIRAALATIFPAPAAPARDGEHWTSVKVRPDGQGLRIGLCWTEEEARLERGRAVDFMAERIAGARQGERQSAQAAASELARRWLQARLTVLSNVERRTDRRERNEGIAAAWRVAIEELCFAFGVPEPQPETDIGVQLLERDEERRRSRHDAGYARRKAGQIEASPAELSPLARAAKALRKAEWRGTASRLEAGLITPSQAIERMRRCIKDEPSGDDAAAIAALEALCAAQEGKVTR